MLWECHGHLVSTNDELGLCLRAERSGPSGWEQVDGEIQEGRLGSVGVFIFNVALIWSDFALKGEAGLSDSFCLRFI